jgi:recombination protein RecA
MEIKEIETEVTVEELKELYNSGLYNIEIDTPDGYQQIGKWFNKGIMPLVNIVTENYATLCAERHLLQAEDNSWILANELSVGDKILTKTGVEEIIVVNSCPSEECYDFEILHNNHRYWGDGISSHNSGKSYICSGNVVKHAQEQGIYVVLIDSENALDESWLKALGVDTSEDKLLKLNMAMIDDVALTISEFMKEYKVMTDRPKVLFVIDSLGMLLTPTDIKQFEDGDLKGDMGRKPKALTALVRNCVNMFGSHNVGMVCTNHSYASQDMFNPDDKISGGQGFIYASSIVVAMRKYNLKEDLKGNKTTTINGIRATCKIMKTRYAKPFETLNIKIPYTTGMNPTSGLLELFETRGLLKKDGNSLRYDYPDGTPSIKQFRKAWESNKNGSLDIVMLAFSANSTTINTDIDTGDDEDE